MNCSNFIVGAEEGEKSGLFPPLMISSAGNDSHCCGLFRHIGTVSANGIQLELSPQEVVVATIPSR